MKKQTATIEYPGGKVLPKQYDAHVCNKKVVGVVGGFASGKSYWAVMQTLKCLLENPGNEGLYGRLTLDEIRRTFFPIFYELCPQELIISHNKQEQRIILRTSGKPSTLWYVGLDDAKNAQHKLKSMNLGFATVDQLEEISHSVYLAIKGRLRNKAGTRQFFFNCNPEGHNWIWKMFIRKRNPDFGIFEMNAWSETAPVPTQSVVNARAKVLKRDPHDLVIDDFPDYLQYTDNPYLPIDYLMDMLNQPEQFKSRYVFGKWDAFEGLIYTQFNDKVHIIPAFDTLSKDYVRVVSMDYGKQNPMSIHFWDIYTDGTIYCTGEIYQTQLDISTAKIMIRAMNREKEVHTWIADGSIWDERIEGHQSVGQLFEDNSDTSGWSIRWKRADRGAGSVEAGIEIVRQYLKHDQFTDNKSRVYFFKDKTPKLLDEIQDYRYKELAQSVNVRRAINAPETPRKFNDHAMDDMRYALAHIKRYDIRPVENSEDGLRGFLRQYKQLYGGKGSTRGFMVK